jgi:rubrerythrin
MDPARARGEFVRGLELAYSGELGAVWAYLGHRRSLPHGEDRRAVHRILVDEVRHRHVLLAILVEMGSGPDPRCERKLRRVGRAIAAFCRVGGWFLPMYGAARLEADNIVEYEILARLAWHAGRRDLVDVLLDLAEVEWDHERVLRLLAASHPLWRLAPRWPVPPPRASLRERFAAFAAHPTPVQLRRSFLVR